MRRLVHHLLGGIPVSPAATRAIVATMADWRHEAEAANSIALRAWVALAGVASVVRVLASCGLKELPVAWKAPIMWRTAAVFVTFIIAMVVFNPPERFAVVMSGWDLTLFTAVQSIQSVLLVLPLVAFIAEARGSRVRQAPTAGAFALMSIVIAAAVSLLPEVATLRQHTTWLHFANAATPPPLPLPSLYRLFVEGPVMPMTADRWISAFATVITLVASTVALSALAYQVRQRRSVRAWLIGIAPFAAVPVTLYGSMILLGLLGADWRYVVFVSWPIRGAVVLLSVTLLPVILAAHLARSKAAV